MANLAIEALIKCPFFMKENVDYICCEGFVKNTSMLTKFPTSQAKREHEKKFCYKEDGGKCPLAVNLYEKYKKIEEREKEEHKKKMACLSK